MQTLLEILTEQTQELKKQYIINTKIWASVNYERIVKRIEDYYKMDPKNMVYKNDYYSEQKWVWNTGRGIKASGLDAYILKQEKNAEQHYDESIEKLAYRLGLKGFTTNDDLSISTGQPSKGNFETIIKSSKGMVRAWTIIASGAVQKPHYRYLIK